MTIAVQSVRSAPWRMFYVLFAIAAGAITFAGFAPTFYLRDVAAAPLTPLLIVHGVVFTAWIALFLTQASLVSAGRTDLHMKLGRIGAVLAILMVILGVMAALDALATDAPRRVDVRVFAMRPFSAILIFAGLVGWAVAMRGRSEWHKRLMVMATVSILTPAIARIVRPLEGGPIVWLALTAMLVAGVIAFDWIAHRRLHPAYAWGGGLIALGKPVLVLVVAMSAPWLALMDLLRP